MGEACGLHQIGHADAVEAMLAKQAASCRDDVLAILCGLLFGQFDCTIPRKINSLPLVPFWWTVGDLTAGLLREQQADGSALFNIMRNLGGSVGTALLSTMITQREQFHDFRIGERVTPYIFATVSIEPIRA